MMGSPKLPCQKIGEDLALIGGKIYRNWLALVSEKKLKGFSAVTLPLKVSSENNLR